MDGTLAQIIRDLTLLSEECVMLREENAKLREQIAKSSTVATSATVEDL